MKVRVLTDSRSSMQKGSKPGIEHARKMHPKRHYRASFIFLAVLLAVLLVVSICVGRYPVDVVQMVTIILSAIQDWWGALTGSGGAAYDGTDPAAATAVMQVRLPRVIVCAAIGAALSIAGATYQGVFQNPMVSQDVLGASSGASFGAALAILLGFSSFGISTLSFVFAISAVAVAYAVSRISPTIPILALILSGMVVSALFSSGVSAIKLVADTEQALPAITYWLMGSLASIRPDNVLPTLIPLVIVSLPIFLLRWRINLLATGEEEAKSLGMNTEGMRITCIGCATLLTAICVSVSGLIGWVGLVIPHFCRLMIGYDYKRIIPASMLMGASFLLAADDICRLVTTSEIPIGILTSFVGAPIFIYLIAKGGARGRVKR